MLLVNTNTLIVGRLNGDIAGSLQLYFYPPNNEAQKTIAKIQSHFVVPWARGYGLAKTMIDYAIVKSKRKQQTKYSIRHKRNTNRSNKNFLKVRVLLNGEKTQHMLLLMETQLRVIIIIKIYSENLSSN